MAKPLVSTQARRIHLSVRRRLHEDVVAGGFSDLSPVHLYVFQLPGPEGRRPGEIASDINMTKQATNHLLNDLEQRGYIRRVTASDDGRAKTVTLTARGRRVMKIMSASSRALEREWARAIGADRLEDLRSELVRLAEVATRDEG